MSLDKRAQSFTALGNHVGNETGTWAMIESGHPKKFGASQTPHELATFRRSNPPGISQRHCW